MAAIQPVQDIFGLGRLAQSIRQNRQDELQRQQFDQQAETAGLQQDALRLGIQEKQGTLSDLANQRRIMADMQTAISQDSGKSKTLQAIEFLKTRDPVKAQELINSTMDNAGKLAKFNAQGALDFVNTELGRNWKLVKEDAETITVDMGDKTALINKTTGDVIKKFPKARQPTSLIQNLVSAGLKQGTPAFNQALLATLQKTGKTQTIEIDKDGGIKIIEKTGLPEQKFEMEQKEAEIADKKRTKNTISQANTVINKVDQVLKNIGLGTAGAGALFSIIPGTPARDLAANIATLKANLAFNALQAMREASKTGGALGAISERELDLLEAQIASLDPKQSPEQLRINLNEVRQSFKNMLDKATQPKELNKGDNVKIFNFDAQGNIIQ